MADATARSWWGWAYLVVVGSLFAYTAFVWVVGHAPLSLVATYAYVNPVVAVLLGWWILGEPLTVGLLVGGAIVVVGVMLVVSAERLARRKRRARPRGAAAHRDRPRPSTDLRPLSLQVAAGRFLRTKRHPHRDS